MKTLQISETLKETISNIDLWLKLSVWVFPFSLQSTPDNSNLQGQSKKVRVIGSSKKIAGSKEKSTQFLLHSEHSNYI